MSKYLLTHVSTIKSYLRDCQCHDEMSRAVGIRMLNRKARTGEADRDASCMYSDKIYYIRDLSLTS